PEPRSAYFRARSRASIWLAPVRPPAIRQRAIRRDAAQQAYGSAKQASPALQRSAKTTSGWILRATRRLPRPRRAVASQALWPRPADDWRRVVGAKACAPGRSRVWAAMALRREARPTASIARPPHRSGPAP